MKKEVFSRMVGLLLASVLVTHFGAVAPKEGPQRNP
jgi:hypothetical protein